MTAVSTLSDDDLEAEICTWAGRVAAGTAKLLSLVREFDEREAWAGPGMLSCAHWLSWRIGLSPGTAREWVRVATWLPTVPTVQEAFGDGRMSWSQVRAVSRVATADDGVDWVELASHSSAAQLERIVRGMRRAHRLEEAAADPERAAYQLRTRTQYDDDGNMVITIYANAEDGAVILAGLDATKAELQRQRDAQTADTEAADTEAAEAVTAADELAEPADVPAGTSSPQAAAENMADAENAADTADTADTAVAEPEPTAEPPAVTDAEALLVWAQQAIALQKSEHPSIHLRNRSALTVQIDPISGWGRLPDGEVLPPTSLKHVMKALPGRGGLLRLRPLTPADLRAHDLGRTRRDPSQALRELLGALDGERCRFPGCTRHRTLHAHHVRYWRDGGPTDLGNLILLCSRHHTLVHKQGFHLVLHADRRLEVRTDDGTAVLHHPAQPWGDPHDLDPDRTISATTLPPTGCDSRLDLHYAVSVLLNQAA